MKSQFKSRNLFGLVFAFIALLSIIKPNNYLILAESRNFNIDKKTEFSRDFSTEDKYLTIEVEGEDSSINYIVSVYSNSKRENRIQLGQSFNGKTKLYLKLDSFKDKVYFDLECSDYSKNKCNGKINYEVNEKIPLEEGESFSYYVYDGNTEMEFSLSTDSSMSNVWARGQFDITTTLKAQNIKANGKDNYYIVTGKMEDVKFTVEGKEGDYINVGYIGYNENKNNENDSNKDIIIDGPILAGYLKKDKLENICFTFGKISAFANDYIFGTGNVFSKFISSYSAKVSGDKLSKEELFSSGYIKKVFEPSEIDLDNYKQCFTFPDVEKYDELKDLDEIIFTYQLTTGSYSNVYEPQINGLFYPRFTSRGTMIAFIGQKNEKMEKMTLSLMEINGYPKMYVYNCTNYPICNFKEEDDPDNNIRPRNINRFSSLSFEKVDYNDNSPISKNQTIFFVECQRSQQTREDNHFDKYCEFNTLIFKNNDKIEY